MVIVYFFIAGAVNYMRSTKIVAVTTTHKPRLLQTRATILALKDLSQRWNPVYYISLPPPLIWNGPPWLYVYGVTIILGDGPSDSPRLGQSDC